MGEFRNPLGDVFFNLRSSDDVHRHRHGGSGAEPVAVVVPARVVAALVQVAEQEGQGGELPKAAPRLTWRKKFSTQILLRVPWLAILNRSQSFQLVFFNRPFPASCSFI